MRGVLYHPQVEDVAVIGIDDEEFGQQLIAYVLPINNPNLSKEEVFEWLRSKVARFQLPKDIIFVN